MKSSLSLHLRCFLLLLCLSFLAPASAFISPHEVAKQAQVDGSLVLEIEECSLPCVNSGRCLSFDSDNDGVLDPQCICPANVTGTLCETPKPCSLPCENGGSCEIEVDWWFYGRDTETLSEYIFACVLGDAPGCTNEYCECPNNVSGELCEVSCDLECENGSTCEFLGWPAEKQCKCYGNFYGDRCENECSIGCMNNGRCVVSKDGSEQCICDAGFEGDTCETAIPCDKECINGGVCTFQEAWWLDTVHNYDLTIEGTLGGIEYGQRSNYCKCPEGLLGDFCEVGCDCGENGECTDFGNVVGCLCDEGYSGETCQFECSLDCQNNGLCVSDGVTEQCECQLPWEGDNCETPKPCDLDCANGGSCVSAENWGYLVDSLKYCKFDSTYCPTQDFQMCECASEWTGSDCTEPCPCENGGECNSIWSGRRNLQDEMPTPAPDNIFEDDELYDLRGYYCYCPFGYSGLNCEEKLETGDCGCLNGGICNSVYYNGTDAIALDDDGIDSIIGDTSFPGPEKTCSCPDDFTGDLCEVEVDACFNACLNGGTCNPGSTTNIQGLGNRNLEEIQSEIQFSCSCPEGTSGTFCESKGCGSGSCAFGSVCIELADGETTAAGDDFVCDCFAGGSNEVDFLSLGRYCDAPAQSICAFTQEANNEPWACANGGRCYYGDSGPSCYCPEPFTGPKCEYKSTNAEDMVWSSCGLTCENGGTCLKGPNKPIGDIFLPFLEATKKADLFDYAPTEDYEYCYCPAGYFGVQCEKQYERCGDEHICFHGSTCEKRDEEKWGCNCEGTLGAGLFCQYEATDTCGDEDVSTFCTNKGTCTLGGDPVCSCVDGWEGDQCEVDPTAPVFTLNEVSDRFSAGATIDSIWKGTLVAMVGTTFAWIFY